MRKSSGALQNSSNCRGACKPRGPPPPRVASEHATMIPVRFLKSTTLTLEAKWFFL